MRFPTAFAGKYSGFKKPYDFTGQDGSKVSVQGKLQFLVRDEQGQAEVIDVAVKQWNRATSAKVEDLNDGDDFKLSGDVTLTSDRGYFVLRAVEAL